MNEDEQKVQSEAHQPRWLDDFLEKKFFEPCSSHLNSRNKLNIYCINCKVSACKCCLSSGHHQNHQILQVFRNVYKDVVCLAALETYIDCSKIQPFKCNKKLVLNRLPLCGSTFDDVASCNISRKSKEAQSYQYCSIACMVKAVSRKSDDSVPSISSIQAPSHESRVEFSEPSKRKRKRKGTPHRAPLF
ncbi:unnamed protein product [Lathyrus sativus]|nr:unnamed protein product [Lathyrus sativus]